MIVILLPYDRGCPHYLWTEKGYAVISAQAVDVLRMFGIPLSNEYRFSDTGEIVEVASVPNYPSNRPLDLAGARRAVDTNLIKITKKARKLLNEGTP